MKYVWDLDPIAFSVFGLDIRWYGIAYVLGFLIASFLGWRVAQKIELKVTKPVFENLIFGAFFSGVLGARLGFFLFYEPSTFISDPLEIFKVWHGGMSIHGGILGTLFFCFLYAHRTQISVLKIFDVLVVPLALSLFFGRLANFMNGELVGQPTDQTWGVVFPHVEQVYRHPSQLYEAGKNLLIFFTLWFMIHRGWWQKKGNLAATFLIGYGILRFFIEFYRKPDGMYFGFSTGQILCFFMILGAFIVLGSQKTELSE